MKTFRQFLKEQKINVKVLLKDYHDSLPDELKTKDFAKTITQCTSGNCADHTRGFINFAKSKGVNAEAIIMHHKDYSHITPVIGNTIVDPTYHQFTGKEPNSIGGHVSHIKNFDSHYGQHGLSMGARGDIDTIEKTPYEKGGSGGPLTFTRDEIK